MKKIKSAIKKLANLDIEAFEEGVKNFHEGTYEEIAAERAAICEKCPKREFEPIEELRVKDGIESLSEKMCGVCGCSLPYLVRQDIKKCSLNKW